MKERSTHVLLAVLVMGIFLCIGVFGRFCVRPNFPFLSSFELQEKYASLMEKKLVSLLEPTTGIGNVKASVQAKVRYQNSTQTKLNFKDASRTVAHESGPVVVAKSVSVLINGKGKKKLSAYQNLIKGAIGFNSKNGDQLVVEMLPFVNVPVWTLGLDPILLWRIGAGLVLMILIGFAWLIKELVTHPKQKQVVLGLPNDKLWRQAATIPTTRLAALLQENRPELSAFILYRLPEEKAAEIVELLPSDYLNQVILHLDYIEKLSPADKVPLMQKTENRLREMLNNLHQNSKASPPEGNTFDGLKNWSDNDLQNLLHYVSKKDLVKALQTASLAVQQILSRNIPPALWQSLIQQTQISPCSQEESVQAQSKIMHLAKLLKEDG